jgi:tRNA threonylcarbamoyladenosine biosynthesis protein TsaE
MTKVFNIIIPNEEAMLNFAMQIAHLLPKKFHLFLQGDLGTGKTTFTRGMLRGLGFEGKVKSPTYTLVEPYDLAMQTLYHFDLYRVNDPNELVHIGIEEYFAQEAICIVEWPEKAKALLPAADLTCYINFLENGRQLRLEAHSTRAEALLQLLGK